MQATDTLPLDAKSLRREAAVTSLLATLALFAAASALQATGEPGRWYVLVTLAVFGGALLAMAPRLADHLPHRRIGDANRVTLLRLSITALLAGLVFERVAALAWFVVAAASAAALLDALDGRLARRSGMASAFGARFDMETDALLILVLAALAWRTGKVGGWVLASGLLRYAFVAAGLLWPMLARPLPASARRKTVCALQAAGLIVCLAPVVPAAAAGVIAAGALAALAASFAADVLWLSRDPGTHPEEPLQ
jgi:phosphatidylglycerophosphate synthase